MDDSMDRTNLAWWFPRIARAGLPVPKTIVIDMPLDARRWIIAAMEGDNVSRDYYDSYQEFIAKLKSACRQTGLPCFLRTGHTSGKHDWDRTCYVLDATIIGRHVRRLVEYSEMASLVGLPWATWAVRELLPTLPLGTCRLYGGMPVCREFRVFVDGSVVHCLHPYWPLDALQRGGADNAAGIFERLSAITSEERMEVEALASRAGEACGKKAAASALDDQPGVDEIEQQVRCHRKVRQRQSGERG